MRLYLLYTCDKGYYLFDCKGLSEVGEKEVDKEIKKSDLFRKIVDLVAVYEFKSSRSQTQIEAFSKGLVTAELVSFLLRNLPRVELGKEPNFSLAVAKPKLGSHISQLTDIPCLSDQLVIKLLHGVQLHLNDFPKPALNKPAAESLDANNNKSEGTLVDFELLHGGRVVDLKLGDPRKQIASLNDMSIRETLEQGDEAIRSEMSLRSCSTCKRKKIQSDDEERSKKRKLKKYKRSYMDELSVRFGRFLYLKKNKTKSHVDGSRQHWNQVVQQHPHATKKGDTLNLKQLLFTGGRDFLITYNRRKVQAKHLESKVIVLHFVPLVAWSEHYMRFETSILLDIYHDLHPKGGFEVVFIGVKVDTDDPILNPPNLQQCFEDKFSIMPWTAIPLSDVKSITYWETVFPLSGFLTDDSPTSFVIDSNGVVLQCNSNDIFFMYGARAYPFTDERMECLLLEDAESRNHPSITKLLASPERNHLINNNKQVVPLQSLEDKVVGLYFYQDYHKLTSEILKAYKQLAQEKNFEIVLVYVHDAFRTFHRTSEDSYWKTFKEMPWLALPFKDLACKKLQRVFNYPLFTDQDDDGPDRSLVIIGPRGKFIELYGADILKKYGISAYPFTRQRVAKLEAECIQELKLNMIWTPKTTFIQKDGSMVQLSEPELVGKRIIVLIEDDRYTPDAKFWRMLRARYLQVKGTDNEFEVIHTCKNKKAYSYGKNVAPVSWLRHPSRNPSHRRPNIVTEMLSRVFGGNMVGLFAFERDGRVVRRTLFPSIEEGNLDFPFGDVEKEFLRELVDKFEWDL